MDKLFEVHMLNSEGKSKANYIAHQFDALLSELSRLCANGRELAIVKTKLEEACFYAKKAMAGIPENQEKAI